MTSLHFHLRLFIIFRRDTCRRIICNVVYTCHFTCPTRWKFDRISLALFRLYPDSIYFLRWKFDWILLACMYLTATQYEPSNVKPSNSNISKFNGTQLCCVARLRWKFDCISVALLHCIDWDHLLQIHLIYAQTFSWSEFWLWVIAQVQLRQYERCPHPLPQVASAQTCFHFLHQPCLAPYRALWLLPVASRTRCFGVDA